MPLNSKIVLCPYCRDYGIIRAVPSINYQDHVREGHKLDVENDTTKTRSIFEA